MNFRNMLTQQAYFMILHDTSYNSWLLLCRSKHELPHVKLPRIKSVISNFVCNSTEQFNPFQSNFRDFIQNQIIWVDFWMGRKVSVWSLDSPQSCRKNSDILQSKYYVEILQTVLHCFVETFTNVCSGFYTQMFNWISLYQFTWSF